MSLDLDEAVKCKHDNGWCIKNATTIIYIYPNGKVEMDFTKTNKLTFTCNNSCGTTRNLYLKASVKKYGKIKIHPLVKERKILSRLLVPQRNKDNVK